ncbi:heme exporter protein CcmB [candidate division KSB1 bacterium]|nr:heme exporter protein CcmB [candidate division KSB1 bacterium]RQW05442.1 MAG: cytochrome C biogenesis protein [candidate division KSB1 bacterium]
MKSLRYIVTIIQKDLRTELRSKEIIISMLVFSMIVIAVFNFIFDPGTEQMQRIAPGILWVTIIFAGNLGLSRSFAREHENARMQGLLLCPIDHSLIFFAKLIGNIIFMSIVQMIAIPLLVVLFGIEISSGAGLLALILFLGTLGYAAVGTLFSTLSANTRSREVMLPILLLPVAIPVILSATKSTACLVNGDTLQEIWPWMKILIAFDVIFTVVCSLVYEYVLEE